MKNETGKQTQTLHYVNEVREGAYSFFFSFALTKVNTAIHSFDLQKVLCCDVLNFKKKKVEVLPLPQQSQSQQSKAKQS